MTQDEIIMCADASGISLYGMGTDREKFIYYLEAFAKLIAHYEREACAQLCETLTFIDGTGTAEAFAEEVRNRGQA
jgi:hypothetical protein